jgi:hypothetical protein
MVDTIDSIASVPSGLAVRPAAAWQSCNFSVPYASKRDGGKLMPPKKAKSGGRKYGQAASDSVERAMHKEKRGTLKSGKGGKGGTVKSREQAIAIGLSEARKKGAKVPKKKAS